MRQAAGRKMLKAAGRTPVMSISDGGALTAGGGHELRPWRAPALLLGAALACIATLALATLPLPPAPSTHPLPSGHGLQNHSGTGLPIGLPAAASASIGVSERSFWPIRHGASLLTQGGGIHGTFTASGASLHAGQGTIGLRLAAVGRGQRVERVAPVAPTRAASQVLYRHPSISEFYRNGPYGLEQGFTMRQRPMGGTGSLVLTLRVGGALVPQQVGSELLFRTHAGATALRYGQLSALDATGRRLPARMQIGNGTLQLRINDGSARYPLRIDPFIQQGEKLTGGGESEAGFFGESVALSGDGNTALIGAGNDGGVGAAWVFTRSGSTWTQQGSKLTGGGEFGAAKFGSSVALSADGNTALIGGYNDISSTTTEAGAAWVFTRTGSTWTQQGSKLTGGGQSGAGFFGSSVALSADGNTALIGGPLDNSEVGAAWVFTRSSSTWTQQGEKLTGTGESGSGEFGHSVALSRDGNTALIGGPADNSIVGAAWVFTRSESTWAQQGPKLTGSGESGAGTFGSSAALSGDGNTALIGARFDGSEVGAAWVFTRSGSTWTQLGGKLTGSGESGKGDFGWSVGLSGDGNTALIGGPGDNSSVGAEWVFTRSGSTWTEQGSKLTGSGESGAGAFGASAALSTGGNTALIGGPHDNGAVGTAWVFVTSAEAPEFGRCVKAAKGAGKYSSASCTSLKAGGSYEWLPGVGVGKAKFTSKGGVGTLETVKKTKVFCQAETSTGEYTGPKTVGNDVVTFTGCEALGHKCSTTGAKEGELLTNPLEGTLGWEKHAGSELKLFKVALDLFPVGKKGQLAEFKCGTVTVALTGSVLVNIKDDAPPSLTTSLSYRATKGKQAPEQFEGEGKDVLLSSFEGGTPEQSGLTLKTTQTSEEALEVNAFV